MRQYRHSAVLLVPVLALCLFAVGIGVTHADIVSQTVYSTVVASNDSNVNFYVGSSTAVQAVRDMSVWLGDSTGGLGTSVSLRLTCFADDTSTSQTGCTSSSSFTSNTLTIYNTVGQEYFFTWSAPITMQVGKYYLLEIVGSSGSDKPNVYGASTLQWPNQCSFAGGSSQCSGTPYFTLDAAPDWTGLNATSTALTALFQGTASDTLTVIASRCAGSNLFAEAICSAFSFVFIPDPSVMNGFATLASTTIPQKFPFSWIVGFRTAMNLQSASSSANFIDVVLPLHSIGVGSTTPLGLASVLAADVDAFGTTTISKYLPDATRNTLLTLVSYALYFGLGWFIFHDARRRFQRV